MAAAAPVSGAATCTSASNAPTPSSPSPTPPPAIARGLTAGGDETSAPANERRRSDIATGAFGTRMAVRCWCQCYSRADGQINVALSRPQPPHVHHRRHWKRCRAKERPLRVQPSAQKTPVQQRINRLVRPRLSLPYLRTMPCLPWYALGAHPSAGWTDGEIFAAEQLAAPVLFRHAGFRGGKPLQLDRARHEKLDADAFSPMLQEGN
ncbi:uncharacterized protein BKA78DRAFT_298550 [Phyllosticta capitalensis]|uniref:uncharacterized protein n=1 Tax=Phyllosticta capitalensis TaxID=121624 RepID=UPI00312ECF02